MNYVENKIIYDTNQENRALESSNEKQMPNSLKKEIIPFIPMPIKAKPYRHQIEAFNLVLKCFGLLSGGGDFDA